MYEIKCYSEWNIKFQLNCEWIERLVSSSYRYVYFSVYFVKYFNKNPQWVCIIWIYYFDMYSWRYWSKYFIMFNIIYLVILFIMKDSRYSMINSSNHCLATWLCVIWDYLVNNLWENINFKNISSLRSHWWQIGITPIKRLDPKIVMPHRCRILRLMNETPPQSTMYGRPLRS